MKNRILAIVLLFIFASPIVEAQTVGIRGGRSCGKWTNDRAKEGWSSIVNEAWTVGFLSGLAMKSGKNIHEHVDNDSIYLFIDNYCRTNPLKSITDASLALFDEVVQANRL